MIGRKSGQKKKGENQFNIEDWHNRYVEQAKWTADLRTYLVGKSQLSSGCKVLDVGCGTGALVSEFQDRGMDYLGIDLSYRSIQHAHALFPATIFAQGNGLSLPFEGDIFDVSFCHFVMMWIEEPLLMVKEMTRVTRPGGKVIAFAEPDYGGRIDFPDDLTILADYQVAGLKTQGANPYMGRNLAELFGNAELTSIHIGVIGGEWTAKPIWKAWESEWEVFESDLSFLASGIPAGELEKLKEMDRQAYTNGSRVLFVPTFYAMGIVA